MSNASQRHKLEIRGYDSSGGRKALSMVLDGEGTNTKTANIILNGLWSSGDTITVNTNIGAGNVASVYSPSGNEDAVAAATGLAAVINGKADHTSVGDQNIVRITKTTAGTVSVVSHVIT